MFTEHLLSAGRVLRSGRRALSRAAMVSMLKVLTFVVGRGVGLLNKQKYQRVMTVRGVTGGRRGDREGHIEQRGQGRSLLS